MVPWDIDFVLGSGSRGANEDIFYANDPTVTKLWNTPPFQRVYLRAFLDAIAGPLQSSRFDPVVDRRFAALTANGVGVASPQAVKSWVVQRRSYLTTRIAGLDTSTFAITSNNGADFSTAQAVVTLTGSAPISVATVTVNGTPMPVTWMTLTTWTMQVALGAPSNLLQLGGLDSRGQVIPGVNDSIRVQFTGTLPSPEGQVVINEIMYNPLQSGASFVEIHNRSTTATFDISGWRLEGVSFTFPTGTLLGPGAYAAVAGNLEGFAAAYGFSVLPVGQYAGTLQNNGERLRLVKPGATPDLDLVVDEVRYDNEAPWPPTADGHGPSLQLIDAAQDNWQVANWAASSTNAPVLYTPGRVNSVIATLPTFPQVFINEGWPRNTSGPIDGFGDRDPLIELQPEHKCGRYFRSLPHHQSHGPDRVGVPQGTRVGAKQWLVVWVDGEPGESTSSALHTSFRLQATNGVIALARQQLGVPVVLDYVEYEQLPAGLAFGSYPEGQFQERRLFHLPSPGTTNSLAAPPIQVWVNEWMAANSGWVLDPADAQPDDWFELYNGGAGTVDLSAYTLTDDPLSPAKFVLPNGTSIPAGGHLLVWADEQTGQSTNWQLHVNFKLSNSGENLGLYAPNGDRVDLVQFGRQTNNVSQGRFPDGMTEPFVFMILPSPGQENQFATANQPPILTAIGARNLDEGQTLQFTATATDQDAGQKLSYSLAGAPAGAVINAATGAFLWTTTEADGPGQYSFAVRVSDNGVPPRLDTETITVTVRELNSAPIIDPVSDQTVDEGAALLFTATARDADLPLQVLRYTLEPGAPAGAAINALTGEFSWTPAEAQGPGTYPISIRVSDDANPSASALRSFTVQVNETDNPPVFTPVSLQTVDEGRAFGFTVVAQDPDTPARPLAYSVVSGPAGLQINSTTGMIAWTPDERQGPNSYPVEIRANEVNGTRSATLTFSIVVNEVNQAPVVAPLQDWTVSEGAEVRFVCTATDSDLPAQSLLSAWNLARHKEPIDPNTGQFAWQLETDIGPSTNRITVRVTDDAIDAKSATASFTVTVRAEPRIVINEIMHRAAATSGEYVELHNFSTNTAWSLAGWRLSGTEFSFPAGTIIAPAAYLVVARNVTVFQASYGGASALGNYINQLAPDGGTIALWRPVVGGGESLVDYVTFSAQAPWPALANGGGASLQLIDSRQDNSRVANWAAVSGTSTNAPQQVIAMEDSWRYWQDSGDPAVGWQNRNYDDSSWPSGLALLYVENAALPATKNTQLTLGR
jgi:hypothetical protein